MAQAGRSRGSTDQRPPHAAGRGAARDCAGMIVVAVLSSVHLGRPASGGVSVRIAVGTAALAAIALIWLPPVVRLLALTGGGFKAFGFEASTGGLRDAPEALIASLARIR